LNLPLTFHEVGVRNSAARRANIDTKHKLLLSGPATSAKDLHVVDRVIEITQTGTDVGGIDAGAVGASTLLIYNRNVYSCLHIIKGSKFCCVWFASHGASIATTPRTRKARLLVMVRPKWDLAVEVLTPTNGRSAHSD
jgi:hypothetical protein